MKTAADVRGLARAMSYCNPINGLVATFRAACLGDAIPAGAFALSTGICASLLLLGCCYFRRAERRFADII
jgi:ABC-type polysaccharide/polyol phosphate export permease